MTDTPEVQGRLLYVFVVAAHLPDSQELAPPAIMVFGRLPDGHELHSYVLRESPKSKTMAAIMLRMWGDIPPQHVVDLEDAAALGLWVEQVGEGRRRAVRDVEEGEQVGPDADEPQRR